MQERLGCHPKSISIHALREEGDVLLYNNWDLVKISIHALREEGDDMIAYKVYGSEISIHALREEGDGRTSL